MIAIALAIGSSLVYGVSDFLGGLKSRSLPLLSVLLISQSSALVLLAALVTVLAEGPPGGEFIIYGVLAGLAEAVGVAALYRGLAAGTMSIVAPVAAPAPVVPVVVGITLGETPNAVQSTGIALAVAGVAIISAAQPVGSQSRRIALSVTFGLLTALGFGGFLVGMNAASEGGVPWALLVARLTTLSVFACVAFLRRPALGVPRRELPVLASLGSMIVGADAMYAIASTKGLLSVVAVLSSLYPVVTIVLARAYLHEQINRTQRLGAAVALCGVAAISLVSA